MKGRFIKCFNRKVPRVDDCGINTVTGSLDNLYKLFILIFFGGIFYNRLNFSFIVFCLLILEKNLSHTQQKYISLELDTLDERQQRSCVCKWFDTRINLHFSSLKKQQRLILKLVLETGFVYEYTSCRRAFLFPDRQAGKAADCPNFQLVCILTHANNTRKPVLLC